MFKLVNRKLRKFYDLIAKSFISIIVKNAIWLILFYLIISTLLSLGLFQVKFNMDTDSLTMVRNSPSMNDAKVINQTFTFDQHKRHFINKLLDLGHYIEIIVSVKSPNSAFRHSNEDLLKSEFNMINETILKEFNKLYDSIVNLSINETVTNVVYSLDSNKTFNQTIHKSLSYMKDLCARRYGKCSIEGGLIRFEPFQEKLLKNLVDYQIKDPKSSHGDAKALDGFSFN